MPKNLRPERLDYVKASRGYEVTTYGVPSFGTLDKGISQIAGYTMFIVLRALPNALVRVALDMAQKADGDETEGNVEWLMSYRERHKNKDDDTDKMDETPDMNETLDTAGEVSERSGGWWPSNEGLKVLQKKGYDYIWKNKSVVPRATCC